jgi:hypothetical protein
MRERRIPALAVVVALLATQGSIPAGAQTPGGIPAATLGTLVLIPGESPAPLASTHPVSYADSLAFQSVSRNVGPRTRVRVFGPTGPYEALGSDLTLQGIRSTAPGEAGGPESGVTPWSEIHQVQVRGSAAGQGAMIGGVTAGLVGLGLAVIASTVNFGLGPTPDHPASEFVAVTIGFAGAGAVVGGMVGALTPKWKKVHSWAGF